MAHKKTSKDSYLRSNNSIIKKSTCKWLASVLCLSLVVLLILFLYGTFFTQKYNISTQHLVNSYKNPNNEVLIPGYAISTFGCKIQEFDLNRTAIEVIGGRIYRNCSKLPPLVVAEESHLKINFDVVHQFGGFLNYCLYVPIFRSGDGTTDNRFKFGESEQFFDSILIKHEFIKVVCYNLNKIIFEDFYAFVPHKPYVEERCERYNAKHLNAFEHQERLSIALVGIDSVSRLNFIRYCNQTRNYLLNTMKAIELRGYHKVGDNTFHNLVPLLKGLYIRELKWNEHDSFDKINFIWKEYSKKGYRTVLAEDYPTVSTFNYEKKGFYFQPADYYLRPFYLAIHQSRAIRNSSKHCINHRLHTDIVLDYAYDFFKTFKKDLYFSLFFMSNLTHGHVTALDYGEVPFLSFLKKIHEENLLNNTVLFFFSDHGVRFGKFRSTLMGKLEERLPMMYIVFPEWFRNKYPKIVKTVKRNANRLVTPFDIYQTLLDLLYFTENITQILPDSERAMSLFNDISSKRTCEEATILPHWCTCQKMNDMLPTDKLAIKVAEFVVQQINAITETNRHVCLELELNKIKSASHNSVNSLLLKYSSIKGNGNKEWVRYKSRKTADIKDIMITFETRPNEAEFEATVRYNEETKEIFLTEEVSRLNAYGDQSSCIHNYTQKKFCYCNELLKTN